MASSSFAYARPKSLLNHSRRRTSGHNLSQWRAIQTVRRGKVWSCRNQHCATALDVVTNILEILGRQNPSPLVAVKNNQIEVLNFLDKELPRRKSNQRKLSHRHAIMLFWWAQNCKVNKINRAVRLQKIAPCPTPSMRFPRHEQNTQTIPHTIDFKQI